MRLIERGPVMPAEFNPLAQYNGEIARGLVHTPEWQAQMAGLQKRFNEWANFVAIVPVVQRRDPRDPQA